MIVGLGRIVWEVLSKLKSSCELELQAVSTCNYQMTMNMQNSFSNCERQHVAAMVM